MVNFTGILYCHLRLCLKSNFPDCFKKITYSCSVLVRVQTECKYYIGWICLLDSFSPKYLPPYFHVIALLQKQVIDKVLHSGFFCLLPVYHLITFIFFTGFLFSISLIVGVLYHFFSSAYFGFIFLFLFL